MVEWLTKTVSTYVHNVDLRIFLPKMRRKEKNNG